MLVAIALLGTAQTAEPATSETVEVTADDLPEMRSGGTVATLDSTELRRLRPMHAQEALRRLPGVHVAHEDGFSLRFNISVRGLDGDRGRTVALLEDGVPIAMAPYGEPELYYAPAIDRMAGLTLHKGAGQVRDGIQTVGATLDYRTPDPPDTLTVGAEARYGRFGYADLQGSVGDSVGPAGYLLMVHHGRYQGPRALRAQHTDVFGKFTLDTAPQARLTLKLNAYDQQSRATHLGLTDEAFARDPRINLAVHDRFPVSRYAASLQHRSRPAPNLRLTQTVYAHTLSRTWIRQDFQRSSPDTGPLDPNGQPWERIYDGAGRPLRGADALSAADRASGSGILFQQTNGIRDRTFHVLGGMSRVTQAWRAARGPISGEADLWLRVHHETIRGRYLIGPSPDARTGLVRDDARLRGNAIAGMAAHRLDVAGRFTLDTLLRFEGYWQDREQYRGRVDGVITDISPPGRGRQHSPGLIPGVVLAGNPAPWLTLYAGTHRGWQPPRTADVIDTQGSALSLGPRSSWNSEAGVRAAPAPWLEAELTGFFNDFSRQVIVPSESAGIVSTDRAFDITGGPARYAGTELSARWDPGEEWTGEAVRVPIALAWTWVPLAHFRGGWTPDRAGNRVPYAPEHMVQLTISVEHRGGIFGGVGLHALSVQQADIENTRDAPGDGLRGAIPAYALLDAQLGWRLRDPDIEFFLAGRNLTDQVVIGSRRPRGIQPIGFAEVFGGVRASFARKQPAPGAHASQIARSDGNSP